MLKTAGLFGLMVTHAIPLPVRRGARFDLMQVMADIGDMQTVAGDLSTFSGHLVVCREMLRSTREYSGTSLVLLDEIGTGTDPAQGAALAQAVLEELVLLGSRVIVTTHYQRVKELAAGNPKFKVAAMEFVENRPTYRLRMGSIGESYALETARRMQLPENVLERANLLLDDETKRLLALQQKLEEEIEKARLKQVELEGEIRDLESREKEIAAEKVRLEVEVAKLREGKTEEFLVELRAKERELEVMMKRVHDIIAAPAQNVTKAERERVIEDVKTSVKNARLDVERTVVEQVAEDLATPLVAGEPLDEGTVLMILEKGSMFGSRGIVTQRNKGRGRVVLRVAGVEIKMERHLLGIPHRSGQLGFLLNGGDNAELSAKDKRLLKMLKEELVDPDKLAGAGGHRKKDGKVTGTRSQGNTVDIRGLGVADAQTAATAFMQEVAERDSKDRHQGVIYINHGNTKESAEVKMKLRQWLKKYPLVNRMNPAELSEGGDAFTVVELDLN